MNDLRWLDPNVRALPPQLARAWPALHGAQVASSVTLAMAVSDVPGVTLSALLPWSAVQFAAIHPGRHLSPDAERMRVAVHGLAMIALAVLGVPAAGLLALGIPAVSATIVHGAAPMQTWRSGVVIVTTTAAGAAIPGGLPVAGLTGFGLLGLFSALWEIIPPRGATRLIAVDAAPSVVEAPDPSLGPQGAQPRPERGRAQRGPGAPREPVA